MSDNPGGIGLGLGAVDPLTGVSPEQGADWLRGAAKAYLDWRAGNQVEVENALMAGAGKSVNELMAGAGHVDLSNPLLMAFAGPGAIKGFHGTPHTFEPVEGNPFGEFRNEAVGTGEGAQAYGWGHYVAGNQKTAESYKDALSSDMLRFGDSIWIPANDPELLAHNALMETGWSRGATSPNFDAALHSTYARMENPDLPPLWKKRYGDAAQFLEQNRDKISLNKEGGNLLEVHILPHEYELLDWDKPLGEQPQSIREAMNKVNDKTPSFDLDKSVIGKNDPSGFDYYRKLATVLGSQEKASAALHEAGIPGIKYLDAGSRAGGSGTYNYVIFDPSNLRIVARNGQRLEPVNHDPFAAQAGKLEDMRLTREGLIPDEFGNPNFFSNLLKKGSP